MNTYLDILFWLLIGGGVLSIIIFVAYVAGKAFEQGRVKTFSKYFNKKEAVNNGNSENEF